ncbi:MULTISPECIES: hydratase [Clostridium]|uniref:2,3-dimethylmalate dehydratase large subunit n=2 Tax=Clostridium TaxID=1485 RepID=D8GLB9_CLOLD|nr:MULTISPECIES: hydratase [Clostridium]ADK15478.1 aconitate hydratase/aconitase [Clostridium ljungdahlii DSM 13528]OAA85522.1 2,3-dimethylmalate dehydratase large subunit [Clostridium ljungdahlii DSM 13528]RMD02812.1 hydratase [Clostridium autoethanogenum]
MIKLYDEGAYLLNGEELYFDNKECNEKLKAKLGKDYINKEEAKKQTIAYSILQDHNKSKDNVNLNIKFDALASHDITFVGIIQTSRASGLTKFPIPYVLTNCHNSLCAVGGTINEDDHLFGLSAAKKYGGIYVPPHLAVIHQYMREMMAGCGKMILGSDSHTRYGALGTMAIGEGGGELVKQLLSQTYDISYPGIIGIYLTGKPQKGIGPQDVALAIIGEVFKNGFVKNKVMEFVGPGIENLSVEYRNGIDVMTTETTCLTSIWKTDSKVCDYLELHGRKEDYKELNPGSVAYYDGIVCVDLSKIKSMIAMPFHPSNVYTIEELNANLYDILDKVEKDARSRMSNKNLDFSLKEKIRDNRLYVEQGCIAGCAGGNYENICEASSILKGKSIGNDEFTLNVYPSSQPVYYSLAQNGIAAELMQTGAIVKTAFCGPCFGGGDTPANNSLSIRHTTRNFPNREGSKPNENQLSYAALMDARSIAATAANKGFVTAATDLDADYNIPKYYFNKTIYDNRVYNAFDKGNSDVELRFGPNIKNWPDMPELSDNLILKVCSLIKDPVTTTDELIPSGDTSSYRSNPLKLSEFTLSRKDPEYVGRSKQIQKSEKDRLAGKSPFDANRDLEKVFSVIKEEFDSINTSNTGIGSMIYAVKPGDGSAREQAASCQKVLGGYANIAREYATKRYRSNLINWGILPFVMEDEPQFECGDYIFIPNIRKAVAERPSEIDAYVVKRNLKKFNVKIDKLTEKEVNILLDGCLINYNKTDK